MSQPIDPSALQKSLLNSSASGSYPITITTFVLGYSNYQKAGAASNLPGVQSFLNYVSGSTAEGALTAIGNAPLPSTILSTAKAQVAALHSLAERSAPPATQPVGAATGDLRQSPARSVTRPRRRCSRSRTGSGGSTRRTAAGT